jgi:hypothetical protein
MKKRPYRRKCGDFEIRVSADGRVVMFAPDDELMDVARVLDPNRKGLPPRTKDKVDARTKKTS